MWDLSLRVNEPSPERRLPDLALGIRVLFNFVNSCAPCLRRRIIAVFCSTLSAAGERNRRLDQTCTLCGSAHVRSARNVLPAASPPPASAGSAPAAGASIPKNTGCVACLASCSLFASASAASFFSQVRFSSRLSFFSFLHESLDIQRAFVGAKGYAF